MCDWGGTAIGGADMDDWGVVKGGIIIEELLDVDDVVEDDGDSVRLNMDDVIGCVVELFWRMMGDNDGGGDGEDA